MSAPNLEISTVVGCRLACDCCPQATHVRSYGSTPGRVKVMALDTLKACLDKVPRNVEVVFAGMAEPWLNPAATAMVQYALSRGHVVSVFTTGVGMTDADVAALAGLPFRHFVIHLPDADGGMKLDVTDEYVLRIRSLIASHVNHHFSVIGPLHPRLRTVVDRPVNDDSGGLYSRAGNLPDQRQVRHTGSIKCSACGPVLDHNVLLPDGRVALCCMVYDLEHVLGNLLTDSYESLFAGPEYARVVRGQAGDESVDLACRRCELAVPA